MKIRILGLTVLEVIQIAKFIQSSALRRMQA